MKKNKGITLIALVITIVIMLLLASVAIQMAMGENGLISKSVQAQKQQAKSELYENAKLSYTNLKVKALENGQPIPEAYLALATTEFRDKYDIVGDDITDKNGNVIDTKANVLNVIQGTVAGGLTGSTSTPITESWPKTVAGVTIPEEDKDNMILKLKVLGNKEKIKFGGYAKLNIDYGNGDSDEELNLYQGKEVEYNQGEYIIKISGFRGVSIESELIENIEFEVLQWGKLSESYDENNEVVVLPSVTKIYEPEPDKVVVSYDGGKMTEIPEWLFSKKVTSKRISYFINCEKITSIPENLFKYNTNVKNQENSGFLSIFAGCTGLTNIPENLFKYNTEVGTISYVFKDCTGLTSIPENLFKYNNKMNDFSGVFIGCSGLISIPENIFKYNSAANILYSAFENCSNIIHIPDKLIENMKKVKEKGGSTLYMFRGCTSASNYSSIPGYMKGD